MKFYQFVAVQEYCDAEPDRHRGTAYADSPEDLAARLQAEGLGDLHWYAEVAPPAPTPWGLILGGALAMVNLGVLVLLQAAWFVAALALIGATLSLHYVYQRKLLAAAAMDALALDSTRLQLAQLEAENRAADALLQRAENL